jgi:transcriptional regulator with XRE-family HTH domain
MTPGELLRDARRRRGVSQARLAIRAGTTQSVISRIERDRVSPTVETLRSLLHLLGEDLELTVSERDAGIDRPMIRERMRLAPDERVDGALAFADFVIDTQRANQRSRRAA